MTLVSNGSMVYLPDAPDAVKVNTPAGRYEITDEPIGTYDQWKYVSRKAAEFLVRKHPDIWSIE